MTDFFREVQEDLQRDRFVKLWRRFRYPLAGLVAAIIVAVIVVIVLRDAGQALKEAEGERYGAAQAALETGRLGEAAEAFAALAKDSEGGYAALAQLRAADAKAAAGDLPGSVALLDALAKDSRVDPLYRDLATLLGAERLVDSAPLEEIGSRLATLLAPDSLWRPLASEIKGFAELRAGKSEAARATFSALRDEANAPAGIRIRAAELLQGLGGPVPKPEAAAVEPPKTGAGSE